MTSRTFILYAAIAAVSRRHRCPRRQSSRRTALSRGTIGRVRAIANDGVEGGLRRCGIVGGRRAVTIARGAIDIGDRDERGIRVRIDIRERRHMFPWCGGWRARCAGPRTTMQEPRVQCTNLQRMLPLRITP